MSTGTLKELMRLFEDEADEVEVVKEGDWTNDHKHQYCTTIVKFEGKLYAIEQSRSGSYWSDYEYDEPEAYEVEAYTKTITKYRRVAG
jgi:hypothetical protein